MEYIKFQIGCLIVSLYIIFLYVRDTIVKKNECSKFYDLLMIVCPWAIIFDGVTSWTVNNLDIVPSSVNIFCHLLFYLFMNASIFLTFLYVYNATRGEIQSRIKKIIYSIPFIISIALIIIFLNDVEYINGKNTNYSMGISVISCYASCTLYFGSSFILTLYNIKYIESRKRFAFLFIEIFTFSLLILQIIFPEILITALVPTMLLVGFYVSIEDPSIIRLNKYNSKTVTCFSTLIESRDSSTGGHVIRTKEYVRIILDKMKREPKYFSIITKDFLENMLNAAPMHDIGKISTPDYILQKPGKLTPDEYEIMKNHAKIGGELIKETFGNLDNEEYLEIAYDVATHHHEKWNGKGYPSGLKENEIPISARIMAIADVFDAVSSKRCYRDAMPILECFKIIEDSSGIDFDPDLVKLFLEAKDEIINIYNSSSIK